MATTTKTFPDGGKLTIEYTGSLNGTIVLSAEANKTFTDRTVTITIATSDGSNLSTTRTITQAGLDKLTDIPVTFTDGRIRFVDNSGNSLAASTVNIMFVKAELEIGNSDGASTATVTANYAPTDEGIALANYGWNTDVPMYVTADTSEVTQEFFFHHLYLSFVDPDQQLQKYGCDMEVILHCKLSDGSDDDSMTDVEEMQYVEEPVSTIYSEPVPLADSPDDPDDPDNPDNPGDENPDNPEEPEDEMVDWWSTEQYDRADAQLPVDSIEITPEIIVYVGGKNYTFKLYATTNTACDFGVQLGFQNGSSFVNVPFKLNDEERSSGTSAANYYVGNSTTQHDYNVSVMKDYAQRTLWVNTIANVDTLTDVTIRSDMQSVNMAYCFNECTNLANIDSGRVRVTNMSRAFRNCSNLTNIDALANWNTANVTSMAYMFSTDVNLANIDALANWNTANVTNMAYTFYNCHNLTNIDALANWNTANVTNMAYTFYGCQNLTNIDALANWNTANVTSMEAIVYNCYNLTNIDALANWNTANVTSMAYTFRNCYNLTNIDALANWNTAKVTVMAYTFYGCQNFTNIDALANWNTAKATSMAFMFSTDVNLANIDALANWNTANVTNMAYMFRTCQNFTNIDALANWNTANVTNMAYTFYECQNLTNIDALANWNTANVTNMYTMFATDVNISNIDALANWNTAKVTNMYAMFSTDVNISNIDALANWNTANVTNMYAMCQNCYALSDITGINNWVGASADCANMFQYCNHAAGNVAIQFNITCAAQMFNGRSTAPTLNVYASTKTNAYNAIYAAMGNATYNSQWQVYLYEL